VAEQCERVRNQDRGAKSLDGSCGNQDDRVRRERAGHRRGRENRKTRDEHPPGANAIAERPRRENEGGKRDRVGADDPLQLGDATAQHMPMQLSAVLTIVTSS
jgi:hypothetical protein